jgi:hypothetical protein
MSSTPTAVGRTQDALIDHGQRGGAPRGGPHPSRTANAARPRGRRSALPPGFDVSTWTRQACLRSGVTFAVEDPLVLHRLAVLTRKPVTP